jgi:hypothetical protein
MSDTIKRHHPGASLSRLVEFGNLVFVAGRPVGNRGRLGRPRPARSVWITLLAHYNRVRAVGRRQADLHGEWQ